LIHNNVGYSDAITGVLINVVVGQILAPQCQRGRLFAAQNNSHSCPDQCVFLKRQKRILIAGNRFPFAYMAHVALDKECTAP